MSLFVIIMNSETKSHSLVSKLVQKALMKALILNYVKLVLQFVKLAKEMQIHA